MSSKNSDGKGPGSDREREFQVQEEKIRKTIGRIDHSLLVMSGKGGVGKSTVAVNLAAALADRGLDVGLLDVDLHGPSIPRLLGLTERRIMGDEDRLFPIAYDGNLRVISIAGLLQAQEDAVIWRGPRKAGMIRQFLADVFWGDLDYLVIDSPPGTGDEPMTVVQAIRGPNTLIVTTPQEVSLDDVRRSVSFCRSLSAPILGMVENMSGLVCPGCGERIDLFGAGGGERVCDEMDVPFLGGIPIDPAIVTSGDSGRPFVLAHPDSPATRAFNRVVDRVETSLGTRV